LKKHHPAAFAAGLLNSQPMGFYQPAQIVQDASHHGVHVRPIDVNESEWDCTLEGNPPALRLGMRLIKSMREADGELLRASVRRYGRFSSLGELWKKSGVSARALRTLARADAFRSLGLKRQQALWELRKFREEPLPLFESITERPAAAALPPSSPSKEVLLDYRHTGLSVKAHPFHFLRSALEEEGAISAVALRDERSAPRGRRVKLGGLVLVRQRPNTARGIVFMTIEDETGITNLIIKPEIFRRHRAVLCDSIMLLIEGRVQREGEVTHVIVESGWTLDRYLSEMPMLSRDFH
jgi:error-prone DNA polymerase